MTLFEIHTAYGSAAVLRLLGLIVVFLFVQWLRAILTAMVRSLTAILCGIDRTVSVRIATGTPPPRHPSWTGAAA